MSVTPVDLGPKRVNRTVRRWRFWHRLTQRLDAPMAYSVKNAVSEQELRRVDEDIKRCRELMSKNSQQDGDTKLVCMRWAPAIRTVKIRQQDETMSELPKHFEFMSSTAAQGLGLVAANPAPNATSPRQATNGVNRPAKFPKRPKLTVLSEAIPLYYIALNNHGFWVAREAEGRCGGVFLLRRSALRFAQQKSAPSGCALMFLDEPRELDVTNQGSGIVEPLTAVIDLARRRSPACTAFVMTAIAQWRKLDSQILQFCAGEQKNRAALELVGERYTPSSNNEDGSSFP